MAIQIPALYQSKPTQVMAIRYDGTDGNVAAIREWVGLEPLGGAGFARYNAVTGHAELWVSASDAWCQMFPGDWVVQETDQVGFYPVNATAFANRYKVTPIATPAKNAKSPRPKAKGK